MSVVTEDLPMNGIRASRNRAHSRRRCPFALCTRRCWWSSGPAWSSRLPTPPPPPLPSLSRLSAATGFRSDSRAGLGNLHFESKLQLLVLADIHLYLQSESYFFPRPCSSQEITKTARPATSRRTRAMLYFLWTRFMEIISIKQTEVGEKHSASPG